MKVYLVMICEAFFLETKSYFHEAFLQKEQAEKYVEENERVYCDGSEYMDIVEVECK